MGSERDEGGIGERYKHAQHTWVALATPYVLVALSALVEAKTGHRRSALRWSQGIAVLHIQQAHLTKSGSSGVGVAASAV